MSEFDGQVEADHAAEAQSLPPTTEQVKPAKQSAEQRPSLTEVAEQRAAGPKREV